MKRQEQNKINNKIIAVINEFDFDSLKHIVREYGTQLYHCSAWTYLYGDNIWLLSYGTLIAHYNVNNDTVYDYLRYMYGYSTTSSQHVHKFIKWLRKKGCNVSNYLQYRN